MGRDSGQDQVCCVLEHEESSITGVALQAIYHVVILYRTGEVTEGIEENE